MTTEIKGALVNVVDVLKQDINWAETIGQRYSTEILNKARVLEQLQSVIDAVPDAIHDKSDDLGIQEMIEARNILYLITLEDNNE